MVPLEEIFCFIDDFCKSFLEFQRKNILPGLNRKRERQHRLTLSEIMTILILFQLSHYRTFKDFYNCCLIQKHKRDFPNIVSYNRFIELIPHAVMPLLVLLTKIKGAETGRYIVDSMKMEVCNILRSKRNKVFKEIAKYGKSSTGWFFGFKLHVVINDYGEIMSFRITPANTDDRVIVEKLTENLNGWLFGDRGYISKKLSEKLKNKNIELITTLKRNMKKQFIEPIKKWYLRKRGVIETVFDQLKAILHINHTRHRSPSNFLANTLAALFAYVIKPTKPHISFKNKISNTFSLMSN